MNTIILILILCCLIAIAYSTSAIATNLLALRATLKYIAHRLRGL